MLPKVTIKFDNGTIGSSIPSSDGVFGVIAEIEPEALQTIGVIDTPFFIRKLEDLKTYIITGAIGGYQLEKFVQEFYSEASNGQKLWVMPILEDEYTGFPNTNTVGKSPAEILMDASKGEIKGLFSVKNGIPKYDNNTPFSDSLIPTFLAATRLAELQLQKAAPIFISIEGYGFTGNLSTLQKMPAHTGWVGVFIGDVEPRDGLHSPFGAAIGLLAGRLSKNPVHVNIGRVPDGAVTQEKVYIVNTPAEQFDLQTLAENSYVTLRAHLGKSGYYFSDDPLMADLGDDYNYITRRRVINKAYRITYIALSEVLLNDIDVTPEGKINTIYARTLETRIEDTIASQMTAKGELSFNTSDKDDKGVIVKVSTENNFLKTATIEVVIRVRPHGYARYIDVLLGFQTKNTTDVNI